MLATSFHMYPTEVLGVDVDGTLHEQVEQGVLCSLARKLCLAWDVPLLTTCRGQMAAGMYALRIVRKEHRRRSNQLHDCNLVVVNDVPDALPQHLGVSTAVLHCPVEMGLDTSTYNYFIVLLQIIIVILYTYVCPRAQETT